MKGYAGKTAYISIFSINLAGFPPTTVLSGTSFTTTAPAAITALLPIVTPGAITALPPIHTLSPMVTGFPYSGPTIGFQNKIPPELFFIKNFLAQPFK